MTPEEKARLETMSTPELWQVMLKELRKAEATLLIKRSLEKIPEKAVPHIEKALAGIQESIRLTEKIVRRGR